MRVDVEHQSIDTHSMLSAGGGVNGNVVQMHLGVQHRECCPLFSFAQDNCTNVTPPCCHSVLEGGLIVQIWPQRGAHMPGASKPAVLSCVPVPTCPLEGPGACRAYSGVVPGKDSFR